MEKNLAHKIKIQGKKISLQGKILEPLTILNGSRLNHIFSSYSKQQTHSAGVAITVHTLHEHLKHISELNICVIIKCKHWVLLYINF